MTGPAAGGLVTDQDGPLLRIRIDRPDKRNTLDDTMVAGLTEIIAVVSDTARFWAPYAARGFTPDRCVPDDLLDEESERTALTLAGAATVAVGLTKWLLHAGRGTSLEAHLRDEAFAMELSSRSEDFREGLAAFAQKRPAAFTGR